MVCSVTVLTELTKVIYHSSVRLIQVPRSQMEKLRHAGLGNFPRAMARGCRLEPSLLTSLLCNKDWHCACLFLPPRPAPPTYTCQRVCGSGEGEDAGRGKAARGGPPRSPHRSQPRFCPVALGRLRPRGELPREAGSPLSV